MTYSKGPGKWSVICKIRHIHMTHTILDMHGTGTKHIVRHIQVRLYHCLDREGIVDMPDNGYASNVEGLMITLKLVKRVGMKYYQ